MYPLEAIDLPRVHVGQKVEIRARTSMGDIAIRRGGYRTLGVT